MVKSDKIIFGSLAAVGLFLYLTIPETTRYGLKQVAPNAPIQTAIKPDKQKPFVIGDFKLYPQADFEIEARVISTSNYYFDDESDISPVDLAVGWGVMSDEKLLDKIKFSQSGRFLHWRYDEREVIYTEVNNHAANIHIIPATSDIKAQVKSLHAGQVVKLSGKLVNVDRGNWKWYSSLSREDTGKGACELMYVESVKINN